MIEIIILLIPVISCQADNDTNLCVSSFSSISRTFYISRSTPTFRLLSKNSYGFTKMPKIFFGNRNEPLYEKCEISGVELICTFSKKEIDNYLYSTLTITEIIEGCDKHINTRFYIDFVDEIEHCKIYDNYEYACKKCDSLYKYSEDDQECKKNSTYLFLIIGLPIIVSFIIIIIIIIYCCACK